MLWPNTTNTTRFVRRLAGTTSISKKQQQPYYPSSHHHHHQHHHPYDFQQQQELLHLPCQSHLQQRRHYHHHHYASSSYKYLTTHNHSTKYTRNTNYPLPPLYAKHFVHSDASSSASCSSASSDSKRVSNTLVREWAMQNPKLAQNALQVPIVPSSYTISSEPTTATTATITTMDGYLKWRNWNQTTTTQSQNHTTTTAAKTPTEKDDDDDEDDDTEDDAINDESHINEQNQKHKHEGSTEKLMKDVLLSHLLSFPLTIAANAHHFYESKLPSEDTTQTTVSYSSSSSNNDPPNDDDDDNEVEVLEEEEEEDGCITIRLCCVGARAEATLPLEYWREFLLGCNPHHQQQRHGYTTTVTTTATGKGDPRPPDPNCNTTDDTDSNENDDNNTTTTTLGSSSASSYDNPPTKHKTQKQTKQQTIVVKWIIDFIGPDIPSELVDGGINSQGRTVSLEDDYPTNGHCDDEDNECNYDSSPDEPFHQSLTMNYHRSYLHQFIIDEYKLKKQQASSATQNITTDILKKWDGFILFNPGIGHPNLQESWEATIKFILKTRQPLLLTAHSNIDARRDYAILKSMIQQKGQERHQQSVGEEDGYTNDNQGRKMDDVTVMIEDILRLPEGYRRNPFASRQQFEDPFPL